MTTIYDPEIHGLNWQQFGRCKNNSDLFEPVSEISTDPAIRWQILDAKAECYQCPVMARCRQDAFDTRDVYGIRGGLTGPEREAVLRSQSRVVTPKPKPQKAVAADAAEPLVLATVETGIEGDDDVVMPAAVTQTERRRAEWRRQWNAMTPEQQAAHRAHRAAKERENRAKRRAAARKGAA